MTDSRLSAFVGSGIRIAAAVLAVALGGALGKPAHAADTITFKASYGISISGINIGEAEAESRFIGNTYAAAISGNTSGPSRLVSNASARLVGSGRFYGSRVMPSSYSLETLENGFATHVHMAMHAGRVIDVSALPGLLPTNDRVPVTARHKIGVVDPLSAFLVPLDGPGLQSGRRACDRTVKVFDGWTRYDIALYYKATQAVDGRVDGYTGPVIVCGARYVPIAGHRTGGQSVQSMAGNTRLEVWLAPVKGLPVLVPYRMLIGTDLGDLIVYALRFSVDGPAQHAEAK
jgi:hypothetical protein